jgi:hypothetical protein
MMGMYHREILEAATNGVDGDEAVHSALEGERLAAAVFEDRNYLTCHEPDEDDVVAAFLELAYANGEGSVQLVPVRSFLQMRLSMTANRLDAMIANNGWVGAWLEYVRALQEVKIVKQFAAGNMEDGRMKWLLWLILGDAVDITVARAGAMAGTEAMLREINE